MITLRKSLLIVIIIILLAIAGGAYWYFFMRNGEGTSPDTTGGTTEETNGSFIGNIADALKVGTAMKCDWNYQGETATFYLKGNKYYGEITTQEAGTIKYIFRDNCTYYWQEGQSEGTKFCVTPDEAEEYDMSDMEEFDASSAALGYEYNCQSAVITDARFTLPSGVEFLDLSQYMQQYMP